MLTEGRKGNLQVPWHVIGKTEFTHETGQNPAKGHNTCYT